MIWKTHLSKWLNALRNFAKSRKNYSKKSIPDSTKNWVMKVVRSSQTVDQAYTSIKLMELAGMTNTEEYKLWSEFKTLTEQ